MSEVHVLADAASAFQAHAASPETLDRPVSFVLSSIEVDSERRRQREVIARWMSGEECVMAHWREGSGRQEHINETEFTPAHSTSVVQRRVALRVAMSERLRTHSDQHSVILDRRRAERKLRRMLLGWFTFHVFSGR